MFAKGKHAVARCQRSGDKIPYNKLVEDGNTPGLKVSPEWRDEKHPAERPVRSKEGIALRRPSPDTDADGSGTPATNLADELFPGENFFGGGT